VKVEFSEKAIEAIVPSCYSGELEPLLEHLGELLLQRADENGLSYVEVAGQRVYLRLVRLPVKGFMAVLDGA
jgi:hypothetical protein